MDGELDVLLNLVLVLLVVAIVLELMGKAEIDDELLAVTLVVQGLNFAGVLELHETDEGVLFP